ncbi:MAG: acylneuraminate cytidylyltransferase family protein [Deltaproteobacteria bacterium]|jgi:CMP-N-acetylneuraminic acid synthetase|nr:acylneuraminate cytidylyltransferase family protein [Deltaproteobacteria bacterium]
MILGVIPARGGSKGIPRKNVKPLLGHPLIAWTIKDALESKLLDDFVVSTEDGEIARVSESYGAKVLARPKELSGDDVASREVVAHALRILGGDVSVLLQPTSPARRPGLLDRVVENFLDGDFDSVATGFSRYNYPPHGVEHRRQDIARVFVNDGSVIVSKASVVLGGSLFGKKAGTMVTSRDENVDIDEDYDFWLAEKTLEKGLEEGWTRLPEPKKP